MWKGENTPSFELCFGPKRTKAKLTNASQLCNLRLFNGRHCYHVMLFFAHKTNVKLEAERTHKLLKCQFAVSVHVRFLEIMILYTIPVHVILFTPIS